MNPDGAPKSGSSGGPLLNYGLSPAEPLPPTTVNSPSPPSDDIDDAQPAPGEEYGPEHSEEDHSEEDHTHEPDHTHWWHRDNSASRCVPVPPCGCMLPLVALAVLGLLT